MEQVQHIGHERQLQHLAEVLGPTAASASPGLRLIVINGPPGAGKRTLIERLWHLLGNSEVPRVLFMLAPEGEDSAQRMMNGARSNRAYLSAVLAQVAAGVAAHAQRLAEAGRPLPPESRLTVWCDLVEQHLVEDVRNARGLQVLYVLPEPMALPQAEREALVRQLPQPSSGVDVRFILPTSQAIPVASLRALFPELTPEIIDLPALTLDEVELWVRQKGLPLELAPAIYQRCGGLPGRLEAATLEVRTQLEEQLMLRSAEDLLDEVEPELRRVLSQGALLPEVSAESLRLFMGEDEASRAILALRNVTLPDGQWQGRTLHIGVHLRTALQKWLEREAPPLYRRSLGPAQEFAQVHAQIGEGSHRQVLARLSTFNYFNGDLLHEVMGSIAAEVMRFVDAHPAYFENTGSNLRLRPNLRPLVELYMRLVQHKNPDGEAARVAAAWERRRQQVLDSMTKTEDHVKMESDALAALQGQMRRLKGEIDGEEENMQRARRKAMPAAARQSEPRRGGASATSLVMQAAGTGVIYFSILLSSKVSLVYAAAGVGLILSGLYLQGRRVPQDGSAAGIVTPAADLSHYERNLHFLNLKRSQLESRQNQIAASIARDRSQLKELDKQLREPYC